MLGYCDTCKAETGAFDMKAGALVTWIDAGAPLKKFLLIRHSQDACAIRFTEYHEGSDAKPNTFFSSGEQSVYAKYEWYYQRSARPDFTMNVKSGNGELVKRPLQGLGRLAFQTGNTEVMCGPLRLGWVYPTRVKFHVGNLRDNVSVELAPTKWEKLNDVKFEDPRLRWYTLDADRKVTYISLQELP